MKVKTYMRVGPEILVDTYEEGGEIGYRPECGPAKKVWLAPNAELDDQWAPCEPGQEGALEFWEVSVA